MVKEIKCPDCEGKGYSWQGIPYVAIDGDVDVEAEKEFCDRCGGSGMIIADASHCAPSVANKRDHEGGD